MSREHRKGTTCPSQRCTVGPRQECPWAVFFCCRNSRLFGVRRFREDTQSVLHGKAARSVKETDLRNGLKEKEAEMETEVLKEQHYVEELVDIIRSGLPKEELIDRLSDYHDNDIADALTKLTPDERRELYPLIGVERVAEIFAYLDDAEPYLKELPIESAAKIVSEMDSDDAVDVLEEMDATTKA